MTGRLWSWIAVLAASGAWAVAAETAGGDAFGRYAFILERQPFGMPPSAPAAAAAPAVPRDSFTTYVRLTALMQEEGGILRVGFVDKKQKDKVYVLGVGESADDYQVLDADLAEELAKIRKGAEEQWLSMKTPGVAGPPQRATNAVAAAPPQPVRTADIRPEPGGLSAVENAAGLPPNLAGLRRASRYAAIRRAEIEREKLEEEAKRLGVFRTPPPEDQEDDEDQDVDEGGYVTVDGDDDGDDGDDGDDDGDDDGEDVLIPITDEGDEEEYEEEDDEAVIREAEIQAHLQSYQKELIRQGLPPLPIPLTAKTDAELVAEGVLPPLPVEKMDADDEDGDEE